MKLVYKNLTICSKAEGSIPVCDTTCVSSAAGKSNEQHFAAVSAAGYHLCRLYAGDASVCTHCDDRNAAGEYRKGFCTAASTVCVYAAVLRPVSLGYQAGDDGGGCKGAAAAENLVQLGFQRIEYEQEHPAIAKTPLLYRLQKSDFNRTDNQDATELQKLSLEQLWELFPIVIRPYNEQYTAWYDAQRLRLQSLLKASIVRISHMGSTAVKGLEAKPVWIFCWKRIPAIRRS